MKDKETTKDVGFWRRKRDELMAKLFGVKERARKEQEKLGCIQEVKEIESEIAEVEQKIMAGEVELAREKIKPLETEALKIVERLDQINKEKESLQNRLNDLSNEAQALVPKRRIQVSSSKFVRMIHRESDSEIIGFKQQTVLEGPGIPVGVEFVPITSGKDRISEELVPALPRIVQNCLAAGWTLAEGESMPEPEPLDAENSIECPVFTLPDVLR
jgi:hypothetical protein